MASKGWEPESREELLERIEREHGREARRIAERTIKGETE